MGAYRLIRRIGSPGGVVETSAGLSALGEKSVFLKRIVDPRRGLAEKFIESSKLLRAPGLPSVLDVGTSHDGLWFVTEGGEGESLRWVMTTLARAAGFIAPNEGLAVVARIAASLDVLHRQGQSHGDLCPSTIFITPMGEVQLHDGGVATALGNQGDLGPARSEMNSLAPEQVTGGATPAADVFRLGLLLYELAVGRPLWAGPSPAHLCYAAASWAGLTRDKVKQVPEPWLTLLVTMLSVEPGARPTMEEVGAVLDQAVKHNGWSAGEPDIARLFARAAQNRSPTFNATGATQELTLTSLVPTSRVATPTSTPSVPPVSTNTRTTSPGLLSSASVVARIATKKMTREELVAVRVEAPAPAALPPELHAAQLLVERGVLTPQQVNAAKEAAAQSGQPVLSVLAAQGADEDALVSTLSEVTHTSSVSRKKMGEMMPGADALALIPLELSRATKAVPLGLKGGTQLMVAMVDPMDTQCVAQIKSALGPKSLITFRAGERALADMRARLYPGATNSWAGEMELERPPADVLSLVSAPPTELAAPPSELAARTVEALLTMQGARGALANQLVMLAVGLARRFASSPAEVNVARLAAEAMVTAALASNRMPHEVPKLVEVQERIGFGTEADLFVEALHAFPARMPEKPVVRAVVLAFAFASHAGEARPAGSRLGTALNTFRIKHQLAQPLFEALTQELSG